MIIVKTKVLNQIYSLKFKDQNIWTSVDYELELDKTKLSVYPKIRSKQDRPS